MAETQPAWEALSAHLRPVNLTVQEIILDAQPASGDGEDPDGPAPPSPVRIPRTGKFARADDSGARRGYSWLDAGRGPGAADQATAARKAHGPARAAGWRMPQEIAVRLGIHLDQRSATWPEQVYPARYTGECLTVPGRDLGRRPVPAEHR